MRSKILFTAVFTVYSLIFYCIFYFIFGKMGLSLLQIPDTVTGDKFLEIAGVFTAITFLSYVGTSYILYGNASGKSRDLREK